MGLEMLVPDPIPAHVKVSSERHSIVLYFLHRDSPWAEARARANPIARKRRELTARGPLADQEISDTFRQHFCSGCCVGNELLTNFQMQRGPIFAQISPRRLLVGKCCFSRKNWWWASTKNPGRRPGFCHCSDSRLECGWRRPLGHGANARREARDLARGGALVNDAPLRRTHQHRLGVGQCKLGGRLVARGDRFLDLAHVGLEARGADFVHLGSPMHLPRGFGGSSMGGCSRRSGRGTG